MTNEIRKFEIEVTPPFPGEQYPPVSYQWDLYVDDEWIAGGTGPDRGNPAMCASFAVDWAFENGVGTHD